MQRHANPLTLLDACAVVNLYATRWMGPILAAVGGPVVDVVAREAQFVWRGGSGDDAREREQVDVQPFVTAGLLQVLSTEEEDELRTFVDLTLIVGDGEAMTAALAIHRGFVVVTDDRKASRILTERGVTLRGTLDLVKVWSEIETPASDVLSTALSDLRQRASYLPPKGHPLREWWDDILNVAKDSSTK